MNVRDMLGAFGFGGSGPGDGETEGHGLQTATSRRAKGLSVRILNRAKVGARARLDDVQFGHLLGLCDRLRDFNDKAQIGDMDITKIPGFYDLYVLKDWGGPLRSTRIQIVFALVPTDGELIILRFYKGWGKLPGYEVAAVQDLFAEYLDLRSLVNPTAD